MSFVLSPNRGSISSFSYSVFHFTRFLLFLGALQNCAILSIIKPYSEKHTGINCPISERAHRQISSSVQNCEWHRFRKKGNLLYFWCDPTTWRTSKTTSRLRSTQKVRATQNFINDKMTERVDILWLLFGSCYFEHDLIIKVEVWHAQKEPILFREDTHNFFFQWFLG